MVAICFPTYSLLCYPSVIDALRWISSWCLLGVLHKKHLSTYVIVSIGASGHAKAQTWAHIAIHGSPDTRAFLKVYILGLSEAHWWYGFGVSVSCTCECPRDTSFCIRSINAFARFCVRRKRNYVQWGWRCGNCMVFLYFPGPTGTLFSSLIACRCVRWFTLWCGMHAGAIGARCKDVHSRGWAGHSIFGAGMMLCVIDQ